MRRTGVVARIPFQQGISETTTEKLQIQHTERRLSPITPCHHDVAVITCA